MFSQYFGHYLLDQGYITREQLADALEYQKNTHIKFGVLAVDEGLLTPLQVDNIHQMQKQVDKRFGEIAVELGYLTEEQVESMLSAQKPNHLLLAQALVDKGYMTIEQFSNALNEYKELYRLSDEEFEAIKNGDIDTLVGTVLKEKNAEKVSTFRKYLSLFAKNMIRFIDTQVYLDVTPSKEIKESYWLVRQDIIGEQPLFTAIYADDEIFLSLASIYAEEELTQLDEYAQDSVSEFLNLNNGIYLVNMSNDGTELNMNPQSVYEKVKVEGDIYSFTVHTTKGRFQLLLSDKPETVQLKNS